MTYTADAEAEFFVKIQKLLNIYVLFLGLSFVKIAGISVTFFIFIIIVYQFVKHGVKLFRIISFGDYILSAFYLVMVVSWMFQEELYTEISLFQELKTLSQYTYWFTMALFLHTWAHRLDLVELSKYFLIGFLIFVIYYYEFNGILGEIPQNGFAFFLVISVPFSFYYIYHKGSVLFTFVISIVFFISAMLSQSRTGTVLVGLEILFLLILVKPIMKKITISLFVLCLPFVIYFSTALENINITIADQLEPYNPRVAELIASPDTVNESDKSWLIRKLMVQKGMQIFEEHPYLGVGLGNFKSYWVDLKIESIWLNNSVTSYNSRSAHNSYIQILSESGAIALSLFILFEFYILVLGSKELMSFSFSPNIFIYMSFTAMCLYFYVIAAITGAITWFILGLALTILDKKEKI